MKLEFDIPDIERSEVIDAIAKQLLTRYQSFEELVRERFTAAIEARLGSEIDKVIAEGWYDTDFHGGRKGERKDLRARINQELTHQRGDSYRQEPSVLDKHVSDAVKTCLDKEFKNVIEEAKRSLKAQLDQKVLAAIAEGIKAAIGLR